jgi:hypothetical protein
MIRAGLVGAARAEALAVTHNSHDGSIAVIPFLYDSHSDESASSRRTNAATIDGGAGTALSP